MLSAILLKQNPTLIKQMTVKLVNLNIQQTRQVRVHKPPWVPRSKAKAFRVPTLHQPDADEVAYITPIWRQYRAQMRSIYQLFKTENKFSDKASLKAQEEKRLRVEEEKAALELNNKLNAELLIQQLADEDQKIEMKKKQLEEELTEKKRIERAYVQLADEKVRKLKEKSKKFIDPNNLEYEIEKMLNERHDYNFSLNAGGLVFKNGVKVSRQEAFNTKFVQPQLSDNATPADNTSSNT